MRELETQWNIIIFFCDVMMNSSMMRAECDVNRILECFCLICKLLLLFDVGYAKVLTLVRVSSTPKIQFPLSFSYSRSQISMCRSNVGKAARQRWRRELEAFHVSSFWRAKHIESARFFSPFSYHNVDFFSYIKEAQRSFPVHFSVDHGVVKVRDIHRRIKCESKKRRLV